MSNYAAITPDEELDIDKYSKLLERIKDNIHDAPNSVRYTMNGFVIAVGSYIIYLDKKALSVGTKIGKVKVNVGDTACKVPYAIDYINKVKEKGKQGRKRKKARC